MTETDPARQPLQRVEDAMREIGTLLLAFTPLDAVFSADGGARLLSVLLFLLLGLTFFLGALLMERRRSREH